MEGYHIKGIEMKLSKKVPARTKTISLEWINKDFAKMSESFIRIRKKKMRKPK